MFKKTARFYDAIYSSKDYEAEAARLRDIIDSHIRRPPDVACGTGAHLAYLRGYYIEVMGDR